MITSNSLMQRAIDANDYLDRCIKDHKDSIDHDEKMIIGLRNLNVGVQGQPSAKVRDRRICKLETRIEETKKFITHCEKTKEKIQQKVS